MGALDHLSAAFKSTYGWKSPIAETKNNQLSSVFWLVAAFMFFVRFLWLSQFLKFVIRLFRAPDAEIHPLVAEVYLYCSFAAEILTGLGTHFKLPLLSADRRLIVTVCIWKIVENLTNNLYYLLLRPILEGKAPHSPERSFLMAILALIEVWLLLGLTWYFGGNTHPALDSLLTAMYFTSATFFTVGYGDFVPADGVSRGLAVFTMFSSSAMLAVVLSRALSLMRPLPSADKSS